jgi:ribosome-associated protein
MLSKKAHNVIIMDLKKITSTTDHFVICSADSDTQVKAIADAVQDGMEMLGVRVWHSEGYFALTWIILDYVDVVAHIFHKEARTFYNLERLWGDAKKIEVEDKAVPIKRASVTRRSIIFKTKKKTKSKIE